MTVTSAVLDEAFERLASSGFELPNGFVNHGPMACEALVALGRDDAVAEWATRFARHSGAAVEPVVPRQFDWEVALGDYRMLPEWIGHLSQSIENDGWETVVATWVPRLMPALAVALFHGAIRSAHAVRAIAASDSAPRRAELARALGYWAARFREGQDPCLVAVSDDVALAVVREGARGARHYLARPDIFTLHGVTGAMAVQLFADHISPSAAEAALGHVRAEHTAMYAGTSPLDDFDVVGVPAVELARAAADGRDPHEVKLVEACLRGLDATGDDAFAAAAEVVVGARGP
ncbi:MAG: hypothetical protein ACYDH6_22795 [Acidimicrobiales bacterium]